MDEWLVLVLVCSAFGAGFVDAVVGGGGLIQIPVLFSAFPNAPPATLFGTNKIASIVGTASASLQYARRVPLNLLLTLTGAAVAFAGAWLGANSVAYIEPTIVRPMVLVLLVMVAIYTFRHKHFGQTDNAKEISTSKQQRRLALIAIVVGYYDGFFGPGTGSFFIFLIIRFLGMNFLRASATSKILNFSTNLAALSYFSTSGTVFWQTGLLMACANLLGAVAGSHLAIRHGSRFVRKIFLFVVVGLISKLAWDLI